MYEEPVSLFNNLNCNFCWKEARVWENRVVLSSLPPRRLFHALTLCGTMTRCWSGMACGCEAWIPLKLCALSNCTFPFLHQPSAWSSAAWPIHLAGILMTSARSVVLSPIALSLVYVASDGPIPWPLLDVSMVLSCQLLPSSSPRAMFVCSRSPCTRVQCTKVRRERTIVCKFLCIGITFWKRDTFLEILGVLGACTVFCWGIQAQLSVNNNILQRFQ